MAFPTSKKSSISFPVEKTAPLRLSSIRNTFFDKLGHAEVSELSKGDDKIHFVTQNSIFRAKYPVSLELTLEEKLEIGYEIRLTELLKICVIVSIIIAFFSRMKLDYFITLYVLTISAFYYLNILIVDIGIRRMLTEAFNKTPYAQKSQPENTASLWISDANRCPACGESISFEDTKCPSCKLHLPKRKRPTPKKTQKTPSPEIKYIFKEKKK